MKLSVYVPKRLENKLRERAEEAEITPSRLIQSLVEEHFDAAPRRLSKEFLDLAGSWEDGRSSEEITRDIEGLTPIPPPMPQPAPGPRQRG